MNELEMILPTPVIKGIEINYDIEVTALYRIIPAEKGLRSKSGLQITQDFPESAELLKVMYSGLDIYQQLSDCDIEFIMTKILSHIEYN